MRIDNRILSNGNLIPEIGVGAWEMNDEEASHVFARAFDAGYRLVDTAAYYHNEHVVGAAIKECSVPRSELFIQTKVWYTENEPGKVRPSLEASLEKLGVDYVDMFLLHWPLNDFKYAWSELEKFYEEGLCKNIGVCNFQPYHFEELSCTANIKPMVDQFESCPTVVQQGTVDYCLSEGIIPEAWGPLGKARVLGEPLMVELAQKYGKTPAQVVLRWHKQRGLVVIPKSRHFERLVENTEIYDFEIEAEDIARISALNTGISTRSYMPGYSFTKPE